MQSRGGHACCSGPAAYALHSSSARLTQAFAPATESQPSQQKSRSETPRWVTAQSVSREHFRSTGAKRASTELGGSGGALGADRGAAVAVVVAGGGSLGAALITVAAVVGLGSPGGAGSPRAPHPQGGASANQTHMTAPAGPRRGTPIMRGV